MYDVRLRYTNHANLTVSYFKDLFVAVTKKLALNRLSFKCEKINLKVMNNETVFTKNFKLSEVISMPIAHSQGNYFVKPDDLKKIEDNDQIIFKYSSIFGDVSEKYNPNGSVSNIAGISNKKKNVMGRMPHPERAIENFYNGNDGIKFFENLKDLI